MLAEKSCEKANIKKDSPESLPKTLSSKTVVQNVRAEMLAWTPFEKTTIKNDRTEMQPKKTSAKTMVESVCIEMLSRKAYKKTITQTDCTKMQTQKFIRKNCCSVFQNVRTEMLAKKCPRIFPLKWLY